MQTANSPLGKGRDSRPQCIPTVNETRKLFRLLKPAALAGDLTASVALSNLMLASELRKQRRAA